MASSTNLVFLFDAVFALVLLISSDVTAAEQESVKITGIQDASSGEVHQDTITLVSCRHGCCRWIPHKGCKKCCATAKETPEATSGDEDTITADHCRHGCCRWYHGHCQRCCPPAEETAEATSGNEDTVTADRCRHGCCRWYHGRCQRCCPTAEETPEATSGDEVKN